MQFFRSYNLIVGTAYLVLLVVASGFFLLQLEEGYTRELAVIEDRLVDHSLKLDFLTRTALDAVHTARTAMTERLGAVGAAPQVGLLARLRYDADRDLYQLDDVGPPLNHRRIGNLTGMGPPAENGPEFAAELNAALALNPTFVRLFEAVPNAAAVSYISRRGFRNRYPWQPSLHGHFSAFILDHPVVTLGAPVANEARTAYWTEPYPLADGELIVAVAAPVDDTDGWAGTLAVELSLERLNRVNADFDYDLGEVGLIDVRGPVIAHPDLVARRLDAPARPAEVFAGSHARLLAGLLTRPARTMIDFGESLGFHLELEFAPFVLVYFVDKPQIYERLIRAQAPPMVLLVVGLTAMLVVTNRLTRREFIEPAGRLVQHIELEGRGDMDDASRVPTRWKGAFAGTAAMFENNRALQDAGARIYQVPPAWRPWFETITRTFRENAELISIRQELDVARRMQLSILPQDFPDRRRFAIYGEMQAAKSVGGDFYDFYEFPDGRLGVVIADVSGKGVPAALFMMISRTLLKATAMTGAAPGECLERVNDLLCAENESMMFVTLFYGVYDPTIGRLVYANGGHNPPALLAVDGGVSFIPTTGGTALGVMEEMPYDEATMDLSAGDVLFMYTDGVTEAIDPGEQEYGEDRLRGALKAAAGLPAEEIARHVIADVEAFADTAPQADDITAFVLRVNRVGPPEPADTDGTAA